MARRPDETLWSQVEGRKKTKLLGLEEKWKTLKSRKKVYPDWPVIDRRFDGSPDRRTRDYHLYDENGYGDRTAWTHPRMKERKQQQKFDCFQTFTTRTF